jgi:hypothetical protein
MLVHGVPVLRGPRIRRAVTCVASATEGSGDGAANQMFLSRLESSSGTPHGDRWYFERVSLVVALTGEQWIGLWIAGLILVVALAAPVARWFARRGDSHRR